MLSTKDLVRQAKNITQEVRGMRLTDDELAKRSVLLAEKLFTLTQRVQTRREIQREKLLVRLLEAPRGQVFVTQLTDRAHRTGMGYRLIQQTKRLLQRLGMPEHLDRLEQTSINFLQYFGPVLPSLTSWALIRKIRTDAGEYIVPAQSDKLSFAVRQRRQQSFDVNVNLLGEAVLGENEALHHVRQYCRLLEIPEVQTISVKISSIASQLQLLAWDNCLEVLLERLEPIYQAAIDASNPKETKLVYLDMEAYKDLGLTKELFVKILSKDSLKEFCAGIALQAYIPESYLIQKDLTAFARQRFHNNGAPIRIRIVKGANLAAERVESSLMGWCLPVYASKCEVDANFKRMVEYGVQNAQQTKIGVASHNVFDLAYTMLLRSMYEVEDQVGFELLAGMAEPLGRALALITNNVLLYAPAVDNIHFDAAVAYLVRRLDENTGPDNFLRHSISMKLEDAAWVEQKQKFLDAFYRRHQISEQPRRAGQRQIVAKIQPSGEVKSFCHVFDFWNEPDTDFTQFDNRKEIWNILNSDPISLDAPIALSIGGKQCITERIQNGFDPCRPDVVPYKYSLAQREHIELALSTAELVHERWASEKPGVRVSYLRKIAAQIRKRRQELIYAMVLDGGKSVVQADAEVSEAVDFAEYYAKSYEIWSGYSEVRLHSKGPIVVTPPWNFPLAIPLGGVVAALVTGNAVVFKPALETVFVARLVAECIWSAGVPEDVMQFVICDEHIGSNLITDARIQGVILTGGTQTARNFYRLRPQLDLMAETGGNNAVIVTRTADLDLAVKEIIYSAFGHAGQKCSAARLVILEDSLYDDERLRQKLCDAAESLCVGSAWDTKNVVTPLIKPAEAGLLQTLTVLEEGESWLLEPKLQAGSDRLWSPGIKLGVKRNSLSYQREDFGPVLKLMKARDLDEAIEIANGTPYGLTAGLFSLDEDEQLYFSRKINAGNIYINRSITGAIVGRQPFGGRKDSNFGPGAKAGGPNYLTQLVDIVDVGAASRPGIREDVVLSDDVKVLLSVAQKVLDSESYSSLEALSFKFAKHLQDEMLGLRKSSVLVGQLNAFRYEPISNMGIVGLDTEKQPLFACLMAALTCQKLDFESASSAEVVLFVSPSAWLDHVAELPSSIRVVETSDLETCMDVSLERLRVVSSTRDSSAVRLLRRRFHPQGVFVDDRSFSSFPRAELIRYCMEQSLSVDYHRYGNLGAAELLERTFGVSVFFP